MSFLSLMEAKLPPGFRFHPRDEELVLDYLANKVAGNDTLNSFDFPTIIELDLTKIEPWDLPEMACVGGKEWYFFSLRDRKYATGPRTNRATISGYWKATGKDRQVMDIRKGALVGMRKTLVFYQGRAPKGKKTDWVMHEFRLEGPHHLPKIPPQEDWVLCRAFYKNRGISAEVRQENSYDDTGSSLPPLMDTFLPFDQTPLTLDGFQQVPCFSNFSPNQTSEIINPTCTPLSHVESNRTTDSFAGSSVPSDLTTFLDPLCYEKEVIKAVLDHFNKTEMDRKILEAVSTGFHEGGSGMGLSPVWNECLF
ncbi:hypothetical protein AAC387_Pa07g3313 [Persea americana]